MTKLKSKFRSHSESHDFGNLVLIRASREATWRLQVDVISESRQKKLFVPILHQLYKLNYAGIPINYNISIIRIMYTVYFPFRIAFRSPRIGQLKPFSSGALNAAKCALKCAFTEKYRL